MVVPAKRQLPVGVSKSVRDPNGGAVALRDLSAIDAPNQLAQDHARSEIRSQASYSDAGSSVSPASSISRSAASSSLGKRPRAVAPSAKPASKPSYFTPADDQSLRDLVAEHGAEGDCDWGQIARSLREGKWDSRQCRERCPRPPACPRRSASLSYPFPSTAAPLWAALPRLPLAHGRHLRRSVLAGGTTTSPRATIRRVAGASMRMRCSLVSSRGSTVRSPTSSRSHGQRSPSSSRAARQRGRKCPRRMLLECSRAQGCPWGALAVPSLAVYVGPLEARSAPARLCGAHTPESRALAALRCRSLAAAKLLCRPRVADFAAFDAWPRLRQHGQE